MEKIAITQCAKVFIVLLTLITPLLSSWVRTPYLYFMFNLLILVLGLESGVLAAILRPPEDQTIKTINVVSDATSFNKLANDSIGKVVPACGEDEPLVLVTEKFVVVEKAIKPEKINHSKPSLFFIGGLDGEEGTEHFGKEELKLEEKVLSGQELFTKAETFIGNFYKQLKIQREESRKRINDLYHKAAF